MMANPIMAELQTSIVNQDAFSTVQLELGGNPNALALRRPFDPVAHQLDATFRLTRFSDLKGWGCKVPQEVLSRFLEGLQQDENNAQDHEQSHFLPLPLTRIGKFELIGKKSNSSTRNSQSNQKITCQSCSFSLESKVIVWLSNH